MSHGKLWRLRIRRQLQRGARNAKRVEEVEQSCHLVVPNGAHGLVVAREENPGTRGFALRQGAPIDMIRSCSGQVILAFSPPDVSDRLVREAEAVREEPVDRDWLAGRLETIRSRGFDQRKSPITFGVTDISYPIHAFDRELIGALTVPFMELIDGSQRIKLDAVAERLHRRWSCASRPRGGLGGAAGLAVNIT